MDTLASRPKGPYIFEADWKSLYFLTKHWISDLTFYRDDLRFLHHVMHDYFVWLFDEDRAIEGSQIMQKLENLNLQREALILQTQEHLTHLADLINDPFKYDSHVFRSEHAALEEEIVKFIKDYRICKKEALSISKGIVSSEGFMNQLGK